MLSHFDVIFCVGSTDKNNHPLLICAYNRNMGLLGDEEFSFTLEYLKDISRFVLNKGQPLLSRSCRIKIYAGKILLPSKKTWTLGAFICG